MHSSHTVVFMLGVKFEWSLSQLRLGLDELGSGPIIMSPFTERGM